MEFPVKQPWQIHVHYTPTLHQRQLQSYWNLPLRKKCLNSDFIMLQVNVLSPNEFGHFLPSVPIFLRFIVLESRKP